MAKDYGPWVRHDWCPSCAKQTEQTRWHRRPFGVTADETEHGIRCNECANEVGLPAT
ncbi:MULTISPECIES: hypothetical protein [Nocardioides]|uniref:Uncharacterized protein n=1 Tax=Nocardioides vastitatis TaxID=2568655 RepID=A0ABW0ZH06_9ACTN|nr:hypothetical protein [Nocardioides sp.]